MGWGNYRRTILRLFRITAPIEECTRVHEQSVHHLEGIGSPIDPHESLFERNIIMRMSIEVDVRIRNGNQISQSVCFRSDSSPTAIAVCDEDGVENFAEVFM